MVLLILLTLPLSEDRSLLKEYFLEDPSGNESREK